MALHTETAIYRETYSLFRNALGWIRNFPVDLKPLLGFRARDELIEMMLLIRDANIAADKAPHIEALLRRCQVVELLMRSALDLKVISTGQYADAVRSTTSIGRQANGWKKFSASPAASRSRP